MLPRLSGRRALTVALAAAALSCKGDPTATGVGAPVAIQADFSSINVNVGKTGTFTAWIVDVRLNRVPSSVAFAACQSATATVKNDTSYAPVPATSQRAVVTGVAAGTTCAVVSGGGLKPDTVVVVVS